MRRPDGLLNHNVLGDDKGPQDACGVFGVWAPGEEVAKLSKNEEKILVIIKKAYEQLYKTKNIYKTIRDIKF